MYHVSDYVHVHIMIDLYLSETLLSKEALEKPIVQAGRTVKHYHSENVRFYDNSFINAINQKYQKISFFGVGAHHQNGKVENKNNILTTGARTLLLHGMIMWQKMIYEMFWPFAMKAIAERLINFQINHKGRTPE